MSKRLKEAIDFKKTLENGVEEVMKTTSFDSGDDWAKVNTTFSKLLDDDYNTLDEIDHDDDSHKGSYMAKQQLYNIARKSQSVYDRLESGENLDGWMESKIAQMADSIDSVSNSFDYDEHESKEEESNEQTSTGGASGSYVGPLFGSSPKENTTNTKKKNKRIPNWESTISESKECPKGKYYCSVDKICKPKSERKKEEELGEATSSSSSGAYSTPKIWAKNNKNWRAVMDKNFPKYGGPGGTYVKVKDKCKKFPYCNQGDINALDFYEDRDIVESICRVAKSMGIKKNDIINRLVETKSTSNLGKRLRSVANNKATKSKKESDGRYMTKKELDEIISRKFYKSPITSLVGGGNMDTPIGKIYSMGSDAGAKHE